ncbi:Peptidase M43- pregnancy-associated plasma-A [Apiospora marii]|uniref:Peptidase M43- pregnancy-associated plasma-A n=1 Tax=Apiospora marii TaxID=335849 RepID=UPI0031300E7B
MDPAAARREGARILEEVEEESLEQTFPPPLLSLSGRYLPFLYHLISTLIAAPHNYTITIVDADHRFDVTRLLSDSPPPSTRDPPDAARPNPYPATKNDLKHVYVYRPARSANQSQVQASLAAAREYMLYAPHASRARAWWGSVVVGGTAGGFGAAVDGRGERLVADVVASWKGWLHIQRQEVAGFGVGISVEEALEDRERRAALVRNRRWEARAREGTYAWGHG